MSSIEEKIKNIRELKNLTQGYMAEKLGMSQAGYSKIESGATQLSYVKIVEISKILGVETEELLAFDSQKYFNSFNNIKGSNNGSVTIKMEDKDINSIYEENVNLLRKLLEKTESELIKYKDRFGDLY
jgi:transcriptional regulator with XRE-family HTH domain